MFGSNSALAILTLAHHTSSNSLTFMYSSSPSHSGSLHIPTSHTSTSPSHTSLMKEIEGEGYFGGVEPGMLLWQSTMALHVEHHVSSIHTLYHKEQPGKEREREEGREE